MRFVMQWFMILGLVFAGKMKCPKYECATLESGVCASKNYNDGILNFKLNPCEGKKVCDVQFTESPDNCTSTWLEPSLYPGEYCEYDSECIQGTCVNNICSGLAQNEECNENAQCAPQLYCNREKHKCVPVKKEGEKCSSLEICDTPFVCNMSKCIKIGSLANGENASIPLACQSFYSFENVCAKGPKLVRETGEDLTGPIKCKETCEYKTDKKTYNEQCRCGQTVNGESYCNPGRGDIDMTPFINYARYLSEKAKGCHVERGILCTPKKFNKMGKDFFEAFIAYNRFMRWFQFKDNPDCVKKMFNAKYWDAIRLINNSEETTSFGMPLFIILLIVAFTSVGALVFFINYRNKKVEQTAISETDQ